MPAKRKRTTDKESVYEVTYQTAAGGWGGQIGPTLTKKNIKASSWAVQDSLVIFYGSGPTFVIPERNLVSIERLG